MKVCLVNNYYPPYIGGMETYVSNLAESLVTRGNNVTVYCSDRSSTPGVTVSRGVTLVRFRTPFLPYNMPVGLFPKRFFGCDYDVIHCNFPNPYFTAVSAWVGNLRDVPTVLTWHNDLPAVTPAASILVGLNDQLSPSYLDSYRTIIATTSAYASKSRTLLNYSRKVKVVLNGVDTNRFNPEIRGDLVREKYGLAGYHVVLFVGSFTKWHRYKGVDVLIEAFARASKTCPLMRLVIVGGGPLASTYEALARDLGVNEMVHFVGPIEGAILPVFYAACDVAVLPSRDSSEGFGLALLEAMACGKAVIGCDVGGIPDLVRDGQNGFLVGPNDPAALAAALTKMYENGERRAAMGRTGRAFAELHDWRLVAASVESIYRGR